MDREQRAVAVSLARLADSVRGGGNQARGPSRPQTQLLPIQPLRRSLRVDESANSRLGDSIELMVAPLTAGFGFSLSPESANNCGYSIGEQLVVDATRVGARWTTGLCNRTASAHHAALDIHALRAWMAGATPVPAMTGMIHDAAPSPSAMLSGRQTLSLRVRIAADGIQLEVRTQPDGSFFFAASSSPVGGLPVQGQIPNTISQPRLVRPPHSRWRSSSRRPGIGGRSLPPPPSQTIGCVGIDPTSGSTIARCGTSTPRRNSVTLSRSR